MEILGSYNPRKKAFQVKEERMKYWVSQRVELSETVHNLLVDKKFVDANKVKAFNIPKKPVEPSSAEASSSAKATEDRSEGKPAAPAAAPSVATETPAEAQEATAVVEAKVEAPVADEKPAEPGV